MRRLRASFSLVRRVLFGALLLFIGFAVLNWPRSERPSPREDGDDVVVVAPASGGERLGLETISAVPAKCLRNRGDADESEMRALTRAAEHEDPRALFSLALAHAEGRGVACDPRRAFNFMERAASNGFAVAFFYLGSYYERGFGVARSAYDAEDAYEEAAERGNISALYNLGVFRWEGRTADIDREGAVRVFERAARKGLALSQAALALIYLHESELTDDEDEATRQLERAYVWFAIAAASGDVDARRQRRAIAEVIPDHRLRELDREARGFRAEGADPIANGRFETSPESFQKDVFGDEADAEDAGS